MIDQGLAVSRAKNAICRCPDAVHVGSGDGPADRITGHFIGIPLSL